MIIEITMAFYNTELGALSAGKDIEVDDALGRNLISAGLAVEISSGGGGGGGSNIPEFTAVWNDGDDADELESFTCNKTYAEVLAYWNEGMNTTAVLVDEYPEDERYMMPLAVNAVYGDGEDPDVMCIMINDVGFPMQYFMYKPDGTLTTPEDVPVYEFPTITSNGEHFPETGKVFNGVNVAVPTPTPTLKTKTITANGTYAASADNADGFSSVTVNVGNNTPATMTFTNNASESVTGWMVTYDGYKAISCAAGASVTIDKIPMRLYDGDRCPTVMMSLTTASAATGYACKIKGVGSSGAGSNMGKFIGSGGYTAVYSNTTTTVFPAQNYAFTVTFETA